MTFRDSLQRYLVCHALWKPNVALSEVDWNVWMDVDVLNSLALATVVDSALVDHAVIAMIACNVVATDTVHTAKTYEHMSEQRLSSIASESHRRHRVNFIYLTSFHDVAISVLQRKSSEVSPASDPKPGSDLEATAATPQAQLAWEIDNYTSDEDAHSDATPRVGPGASFDPGAAAGQSGDYFLSSPIFPFFDDFCEPECSDMPEGVHHPNCSLFSYGSAPSATDISVAAALSPR